MTFFNNIKQILGFSGTEEEEETTVQGPENTPPTSTHSKKTDCRKRRPTQHNKKSRKARQSPTLAPK